MKISLFEDIDEHESHFLFYYQGCCPIVGQILWIHDMDDMGKLTEYKVVRCDIRLIVSKTMYGIVEKKPVYIDNIKPEIQCYIQKVKKS